MASSSLTRNVQQLGSSSRRLADYKDTRMNSKVPLSFDPELFRQSLAAALATDGSLVLDPDTEFRELSVWDSIASVSIVAMVYAEYDVQISGEELMRCTTVASISDLVEAKLASAGECR